MKNWLAIRPPLPESRPDRQQLPIVPILGGLSLVAIVVSVGQGEYPIAIGNLVATLLGIDTGNPDLPFVIQTLRLPRTLVAFLVGVALAISGAIFQGLTRNPLADPSIIGINAGASLAAVTTIVLLPDAPVVVLPIAAFFGALLMAASIYSLAGTGKNSPMLLILLGIGLSAIASACTSLMISLGSIYQVSQALVWLAGSVYARTWSDLFALLPWTLVGTALALGLTRELNVLNLGDEIAAGLGSRVSWQRAQLVIVAVALAGSAVATAGSIGFVGLIAPHIARQLVGGNYRQILPVTALIGGILVTIADTIGRTIFAPIELPCGVVIAAIGAPFFLYLLIQNRYRQC
ncbi:FecCD family ABC transporter permease [Chamaesiphon minutus]|uniref:ABC-type Fe3+-siderophore transport system, permease component n=1 Tax=Chamaesiphon minutus (strain ATCC 27169 / PCC 6605) TaxID=1173020 RepID=K9UGU3_CHAP6|nr:iron ABC transporter permease [Chamaesiphon minutus]AFY93661.1 ABC-type Fe3+-siderophore transport system, permease component [Chamaesiphon minutus PCC 6605]